MLGTQLTFKSFVASTSSQNFWINKPSIVFDVLTIFNFHNYFLVCEMPPIYHISYVLMWVFMDISSIFMPSPLYWSGELKTEDIQTPSSPSSKMWETEGTTSNCTGTFCF